MKGLILVFAVIATSCFASVIEQNYSDAVRTAWKVCKTDDMSDETYYNMTEGQQMPKTKPEKCFKYCLSKQLGHMDGNTVNSQAVMDSNKKLFTDPKDAEKVNGMWNVCLTTVGIKEDECETSSALTVCLMTAVLSGGLSLPSMAPPGQS
ncbi:general odorant-binding protein 56h [Cimex lectularius]|uniref:Odorant binding protein n=1 Tax=Cimex lectularius TaxID=79782 RepID=A0A8I6RLC5_CIMLE|nr:general odorant-binding protein 56h [Cimex lectularius]